MEDTKCVICYKDYKYISTREGKRNNNHQDNFLDCSTVKKQMPTILLLRRILCIPNDMCCQLLREHGHPHSWIVFCDVCFSLISKAEHLYRQINYFKNELEILKMDVNRTILLSSKENNSSKPEVNTTKNSRTENSPIEIIRSFVFSGDYGFPNFEIKIEDSALSRQNEEGSDFNDDDCFPFGHSDTEESLILTSESKTNTSERTKVLSLEVVPELNQSCKNNLTSSLVKETIESDNDVPEDNEDSDWIPDNALDIAQENQFKDSKSTSGSRSKKKQYSKTYNFSCEKCDRSFISWRNLRQHFQKYHGDLPYTCDFCQKKLCSKEEIDYHNEKFHLPGLQRFFCQECHISYSHNSMLRRHIRKHHQNGIKISRNYASEQDYFTCKICGEVFNLQSLLAIHHRNSHSEDLPGTSPSNAATNIDERDIEGCTDNNSGVISQELDSTTSCHVCNNKFVAKENLRKHFAQFHSESLIECNQCNYKAIDSTDLEDHNSKLHNPERGIFICSICDKAYCTEEFLSNHVQNTHGEKCNDSTFYKSPTPKPKLETTFCSICNMELKSRQILMRHYVVRHKEEARVMFPNCTQLTKCPFCTYESLKSRVELHIMRTHKHERPFPCEICNKNFLTNSNLRHHKQSAHFNELGLEPYECKDCDKKFSTPSSLRSHVNIVHKGCKLTCQICGLKLGARKYLNDHMRRHRGEKKELCELCGATFVTKFELTQHNRQKHLNLRPFSCQHCSKKFTSLSNLKVHVNGVHNDGTKSHQCEMCNKRFSLLKYLKRHIKCRHEKGEIE